MRSFLFLPALLTLFISTRVESATVPAQMKLVAPENTLGGVPTDITIVGVLEQIEKILLYGVVPVVIVGVGLFVAYELLTAEWDESKNKQAWKSLFWGIIGIICISLAYVFIRITLSLQIF